ncbi:helix-turn-helix transcriptional regulator [Pediococcus argentinicus]|uniref:helix-turn-helix domain-containing protein n=1 Tax=Pediococcus argentinicus TaxID=480391 RepID=UPI00338F2DAA
MKNRIKELRKLQGLTQLHLSAKTGSVVSPDLLSKYERGDREPNLKTWELLAKALNCSPAYLVGWEDNLNNELAHSIKNIRIELGLTQLEFGQKVDGEAVSGTVNNWEQGYNRPNKRRLKRIAELGNTTVEDLLHKK